MATHDTIDEGTGNLVLCVPEPQGGVDDHEDEGEDDAGEKDEDAAELVNQEPAKAEGGNHHHRWVVLLQGFHLHLQNYYMVD